MKNLAGRDFCQQLLGVGYRAEKAKTHEKIRVLRPRRVLIETEGCDLGKRGFLLVSLFLGATVVLFSSFSFLFPFFFSPPIFL